MKACAAERANVEVAYIVAAGNCRHSIPLDVNEDVAGRAMIKYIPGKINDLTGRVEAASPPPPSPSASSRYRRRKRSKEGQLPKGGNGEKGGGGPPLDSSCLDFVSIPDLIEPSALHPELNEDGRDGPD